MKKTNITVFENIVKKNTLPILKHVLVENGNMYATTNLELFFSKKINLGPGLYKISNKKIVPAFDLKKEYYPIVPDKANFSPLGKVNKKEFLDTITKANHFTFKKDILFGLKNPNLKKVLIEIEDSKYRIIALDGFRMFVSNNFNFAREHITGIPTTKYLVQVSRQFLDAVKAIERKTLSIKIWGLNNTEYLLLEGNNGTVITQVTSQNDKNYPDYKNFSPLITKHLAINKKDLMEGIRGLLSVAKKENKKLPYLNVKIDNKSLTLTLGSKSVKFSIYLRHKNYTPEAGILIMPVQPESEDLSWNNFSLDAHYLNTAVKILEGNIIHWGLSNEGVTFLSRFVLLSLGKRGEKKNESPK